jgi:uncharacterized protein (TIGR00369 family)
MSIDFDFFLRNFRELNTFGNVNGHEYEMIEPGHVITRMEIKKEHLNSPGVAHGGAVAGFMDAVLGVPALTAAIVDGNLVSTVEFKINYFKPILLGDKLEGRGRVIRKGKSLIVTIGEVYKGDEMVAHGQGTFNIYPLNKRNG